MGSDVSRGLPRPEGPIVDIMCEKWRQDSVALLSVWSRDFDFSLNGSFSNDKIKLKKKRGKWLKVQY